MVAAVAQHLAYLPWRARRFLQPITALLGCCLRPPRVMANRKFNDVREVVKVSTGGAQHPPQGMSGGDQLAGLVGGEQSHELAERRRDVGEGGGGRHRCLTSEQSTSLASVQRRPDVRSRSLRRCRSW